MKRALAGLAALAGALLAITVFALESGGVAIVTYMPPGGAPRETHVWFVELDGEPWLEAGAPENPWFVDAQADPRLRVAFPDGSSRGFRAVPARDAASQRRVREALRAKYGWRDVWVGAFVDSSRSVAVRLTEERGARRAPRRFRSSRPRRPSWRARRSPAARRAVAASPRRARTG